MKGLEKKLGRIEKEHQVSAYKAVQKVKAAASEKQVDVLSDLLISERYQIE